VAKMLNSGPKSVFKLARREGFFFRGGIANPRQ
jgi:hypothetical protein